MFVAVVPPEEVLEDLAEFLAPRQEAEPGFRWTVAEQWHLTLAFMAEVADRHLDDLQSRLERAPAPPQGRRGAPGPRPSALGVCAGGWRPLPDPGAAKGSLRGRRARRTSRCC